jgi:hypothetical protein
VTDLRRTEANVRSPGYYIAVTRALCRNCGESTRVLALAATRDHETLDADPEGTDPWQHAGIVAFLFHVTYLSDEVQRRLLPFSPEFRSQHGDAGSSAYWVNHCQHCGGVLDDQELHCEPGVFMPGSEAEAAEIGLFKMDHLLEAAAAGYAPEPEFLEFMRRR